MTTNGQVEDKSVEFYSSYATKKKLQSSSSTSMTFLKRIWAHFGLDFLSVMLFSIGHTSQTIHRNEKLKIDKIQFIDLTNWFTMPLEKIIQMPIILDAQYENTGKDFFCERYFSYFRVKSKLQFNS